MSRQLAPHLPAPPSSVLDVGCGQGTQLLRLARLGHRTTGLDRSPALLAGLRRAAQAEPPEVRARVRIIQADIGDLASLFPAQRFDVVLCHGVLMYVADPEPLLNDLTALLAPPGVLSLLVRNADALAMRPGLLGDWHTARRAFTGPSYDNRIGLQARADRIRDLTTALIDRRLSIRAWYGVRVFTDTAADDAPLPEQAELAALLACEERAGATDPYRWVAALTHVLASSIPPGDVIRLPN